MLSGKNLIIIGFVVVVFVILQGLLICVSKVDSPVEAAVDFTKAYFMLDGESMSELLCSEIVEDEEVDIPVFKIDPDTERRQIQQLQELRESRSPEAVARTLAALEDAAARGDNVIPATIEAVKVYATLGEICDTLRRVYGSYEPSTVV